MAEPYLYLPVLRWRQAERTAISRLAPEFREITCPLIEICPPDFPTDKRYIAKTSELVNGIARAIVDSCRDCQVFLDLVHLDRSRQGLLCRNGTHPLEYLFDCIRSDRLIFPEQVPDIVPVAGLARSQDYIAATIRIARVLRRLCIRITDRDIEDAVIGDRLFTLLELTGLESEDVDLVVDLAILPNSDAPIAFAEQNLPVLDKWRSLTILAGSFPEDLQGFREPRRYNLSREEWHYFDEHVLQDNKLAKIASFGDYTIQHPIYREPPKNCNPSASIRYALDDSWIIMKGEALRKEGGPGSKQWPAQAKVLTSFKGEYRGPDHCFGCAYISEMAQAKKETGNCQTWLAATINHAITTGARQAKDRLGERVKRRRIEKYTGN